MKYIFILMLMVGCGNSNMNAGPVDAGNPCKEDQCFMEGQCWYAQEWHPETTCMVCNPRFSRTAWYALDKHTTCQKPDGSWSTCHFVTMTDSYCE